MASHTFRVLICVSVQYLFNPRTPFECPEALELGVCLVCMRFDGVSSIRMLSNQHLSLRWQLRLNAGFLLFAPADSWRRRGGNERARGVYGGVRGVLAEHSRRMIEGRERTEGFIAAQ